MSHAARVERRTNGDFVSINSGGYVLPGKGIRYSASGLLFLSPATFVVYDENENVIFEQEVAANFRGNAWIDVISPTDELQYVLVVHAQSVPFLTRTHDVSFVFNVSKSAPPPPKTPPKGFDPGDIFEGLGDVKDIVLYGGLILLAIYALQVAKPFIPIGRR